jgi:ribulose-bisphosphate carboxylase large chain
VTDLRVAYRLAAADGESAGNRAAHLAREQSIEISEGAAAPEIEARGIGRVVAVEPADGGGFAVEIDYPLATTGFELPQLLNLLWGNVSLQSGVRVERVEWPMELLAAFPGPAFGVAGLRRLCSVEDRPLTATALKPLGLSPRELARLAAECALGGVDLIKDDHGLADQEWAPFRERVLTVSDLVERANRRTGGSTLYAPNLTGPVDGLGERLETLMEAGVRAALAAPALLGFDALRTLAGADHGLAPGLLFGDLFRLSGADAVVFPNAGGRFPFDYGECREIERRLSTPLGDLAPSFLMLGGGIDRERLIEWVPRYGPDTIWLVGGSLYQRSDLRSAAREMVDTVRRTAPGERP